MTRAGTDERWKLIGAQLDRLLRPAGFRKAGLAFSDVQAEFVRDVRIEKYRWNTPAGMGFAPQFSLMLSLYLAAGERGNHRFGKPPGTYSIVMQKNAGYLWGKENFLYSLPELASMDTLLAELAQHLDTYVLPFMAGCTSIDAIVASLEAENARLRENIFSTSLAMALARLGRLDASRRHFESSIGDRASIVQMARHYGIELEES